MTAERAGWAALILLAGATGCFLAAQARRTPSLRQAAGAVLAFVVVDGSRFAWAPWASVRGAPWAWLDVLAFVLVPGIWAGILGVSGERRLELAEDGELCGWGWVGALDGEQVAPHAVEAPCAFLGEAEQPRELGVAHFQALPALACLGYAVLVLEARHALAAAGIWIFALQTPRVALFAYALWVGLSTRRAPRAPSRDVGLVLAYTSGIGVASGLWGAWWQVQLLAAVAWVLVWGLVWKRVA